MNSTVWVAESSYIQYLLLVKNTSYITPFSSSSTSYPRFLLSKLQFSSLCPNSFCCGAIALHHLLTPFQFSGLSSGRSVTTPHPRSRHYLKLKWKQLIGIYLFYLILWFEWEWENLSCLLLLIAQGSSFNTSKLFLWGLPSVRLLIIFLSLTALSTTW